ncbi:hypothetical protein Q8F57_033315 [Paraburkholderia terrae]|uniref:hypothetical protein n=1 Tax=Paraburkholderia terrae TaxID=311230 RepID=UPI00296B4F25|nr:hypothetical protein [Paraburkholderia terrae]MDW3662805.1 hypothetical protein [Paraburkholderia terrae]
MTRSSTPFLSNFEVQPSQVEPLLRTLRFANAMLDYAFYDVPAFRDALMKEGVDIVWKDSVQSDPAEQQQLPEQVNLTALANPEGAILIVDAKNSPHIRRFYNVEKFLDKKEGGVQLIDAISVSGVGSSALGSAALAWNASTALGRPVAAVVPGYGLADVVQQALGGWFGFEMYSYWLKQPVQAWLAQVVPGAARVGRHLLATTSDHATASGTGVPVFRRGSGSSDVLHAILKRSEHINLLMGHSKGALVIENAIVDLPVEQLKRLQVLTFGCVISELGNVGRYDQFLGSLDGLGMLNSGGNCPEHTVPDWHSTNRALPLTMPVSQLTGTVLTPATERPT